MLCREVLLVYQTDVTMRTQLETTMAALTDAQLSTLCQVSGVIRKGCSYSCSHNISNSCAAA